MTFLQIVALLNAKTFSREALQSLEMLTSVGAPLHKEHRDEFISRLPGVLHELYGLTEGFMTILDKNHIPAKLTAVFGVPDDKWGETLLAAVILK